MRVSLGTIRSSLVAWLSSCVLLSLGVMFSPVVSCLHAAAADGPAPGGRALRELGAKAERGDPKAQFDLGCAYLRGNGVPQSDSVAALWIGRAAKQNYLEAEFVFASLYVVGQGVPRDTSEALHRFRVAADRGHSGAQFWMAGKEYFAWKSSGDSTRKEEALRWMRVSADQGFAPAEFTLGSMHRSGDGVPEDSAMAVKWLTTAAEHRSDEARAMLGMMYWNGEWAPKNRQKAVEWFRESAEKGSPEAQSALALLLSHKKFIWPFENHSVGSVVVGEAGAPGKPDLVAAFMWSIVSAEAENSEAKLLMLALERELPAHGLAEARKRAADWLEQHTTPR